MARSVSIHIGVNEPQGGRPHDHPVLTRSEDTAWRMAELASQAGYGSVLMLRGPQATREAVHDALVHAAGSLGGGDTLFISFSGHGDQVPDLDEDEGYGWDETWCLYDGDLVDDKVGGYLRLFEPGVRILAVTDCCFAAGSLRLPRKRGRAHRAAVPGARVAPPRETYGIRASVLLLAACGEEEHAKEGLFTKHLLATWDDGAFQDSYLELYDRVCAGVAGEGGAEPQILMLGAADSDFQDQVAFRVDPQDVVPPRALR